MNECKHILTMWNSSNRILGVKKQDGLRYLIVILCEKIDYYSKPFKNYITQSVLAHKLSYWFVAGNVQKLEIRV